MINIHCFHLPHGPFDLVQEVINLFLYLILFLALAKGNEREVVMEVMQTNRLLPNISVVNVRALSLQSFLFFFLLDK